MNRTARACVPIALLALATPLAARSAAHAQRRPRPPAARIAVVRVEESSLRQARAVAPGYADRVTRCVHQARATDPVASAAVPLATVVIRLRANGQADLVEIEPSNLARGLSTCLANALLDWRQGGHVGLRGNVQLVLSLLP